MRESGSFQPQKKESIPDSLPLGTSDVPAVVLISLQLQRFPPRISADSAGPIVLPANPEAGACGIVKSFCGRPVKFFRS